jgi:hypothetical protein
MMMQTRVRARVLSKTRADWTREGGAYLRYSAARAQAALRSRFRTGWLPVIPPGRSRHERVTVLRRNHPLAAVARAYLAGDRWFERGVLETALGRRLDTLMGAAALAAAGFALLRVNGSRLELRAADPRAAHLVNRARVGPQRRGYRIHRVLESFLYLPPKKKRRHPATDDRRLEVAQRLQDIWLLDGDDLLNCRPFARLRSPWTFEETSARDPLVAASVPLAGSRLPPASK